MQQLRSAIIQQFKDEGRYSSDSDRSEVSNMDIEPEQSQDPFHELGEIVKQEFLSIRNPTKERELPGHVRHGVSDRMIRGTDHPVKVPRAHTVATENLVAQYRKSHEEIPIQAWIEKEFQFRKNSSSSGYSEQAWNSMFRKQFEVFQVQEEIEGDTSEISQPKTTPSGTGSKNPFAGAKVLGESSDKDELQACINRIQKELTGEKGDLNRNIVYPKPAEFNNDPEDTPRRFINQFNRHIEAYAVGITHEDIMNVMEIL
ncbi:hypothetical protein AX774_g5838 [Zancudomyces culisetae]|uniref:Uncharacterized protein n=1 Tax=Zancudomyces culisetae TaxID=1213189 RepID=A0A1R1PIF4_ZANCU|nr:hypothetical protein AX774_g5838 [Zancudomyces culisetae]|eukprot:OMH80718.1 hypothetical protein AX774_g5838 [Zancudomyces culisetae]